ncbi:MAG TPA: glycosyltransferase [Thermomicrobiales bacterium]|jgi:cellulose synthase (UDP-forming)|nr:glycosyltransferase [Thermomicrobiales bacterium]
MALSPSISARTQPVQPAPSGKIATSARVFGDDYPPVRQQWRIRAAGVLVVLTTLLFLPWMLSSLNPAARWLSWPYAGACLFSAAYALLNVFNGWNRKVPVHRLVERGVEPSVGVIIPTCGESVPMVLRTVVSVLDQDWPHGRLTVVVSDDGHDPELKAALEGMPVLYHSPQDRFAPGRDGAAKAGNLNDALAMLDRTHPEIVYIETRDADDESGSTRFLREVVGQLEADDRLAFVQTIKEAQVSAGDPFNNRESGFYRGQMLARNAANAVFPCGSGVVWRRTALRHIGEFPTWNLVEDLQSGVEALRRGWHGMYLPIVGAVGQHSPEDVPNVYKQRGTWAIDTVRLIVWRGLSGLRLRQRAHFLGMLMDYLNAFTVFVYVPAVACALLGVVPILDTGAGHVAHMLPLVLAIEIWLLVINSPYNDRRGHQRRPIRALWQVRIMWAGMSPIYIKATIQALLGGPNRKPVYKVTRKHDYFRWHWRHTLPQTTLLLAVASVLIYVVWNGTLPTLTVLAATVYWGGLNILLLVGFVCRGWHGLGHAAKVARENATFPEHLEAQGSPA